MGVTVGLVVGVTVDSIITVSVGVSVMVVFAERNEAAADVRAPIHDTQANAASTTSSTANVATIGASLSSFII